MTTIQSDPVGVLNDLGNTFSTLLDRTSASSSSSSTRPILYTLLELTTLLSTAQILTRHALYPEENTDESIDVQMHDEKRRRASLNNGGVLKELVGDLMTLLGGEDSGSEGVMGWLRKLVWRTFEQAE
jgi:hypothetical protein